MSRYIKILLLQTLLIPVFSISFYGQNNTAGTYEDRSGRVALKCDGSFYSVSYSRRDTIIISGSWSRSKNELTLWINSISPKIYFRDTSTSVLKIRNDLIYPAKMTRATYRVLKRAAKEEYHPRKLEPFSKFKDPKQGKLKKVSSFDCTN